MTRTDLLALDTTTLVALTNRGLVKRAAKDLDAGAGAIVTTGPDGTLTGAFPDGTTVSLAPAAGLDQGVCGCGAPGVCRHVLGLVLAHRKAHADATPRNDDGDGSRPGTAPPPWQPWSPGSTDDETLTAAVGARAMATARRTLSRGYTARLRHPAPDEPAAVAELATCTVRFPVRDGVAHAVTDAADALRGESIALAVWAFRAALEANPDDPPRQVDVGDRTSTAARGAALASAGSLAAELLREGAAHAGPVLTATLARIRDDLTAAALHWPAGVLTDIAAQVDQYAERGAGFRAEELAALLAELDARTRAGGGGLAEAQVLGTGERGDTPLRRIRLTALGCRVSGTPTDRTAEVFLAHGGAGIALVLRRRWPATGGRETTGHELAARRLLGTTLGAVATGNVVSENASRTPGRTVSIGGGRLAATSVTPVGASWADLPEPLLLRDFAAHAAALRELPPRFLRPRIAADTVHVTEIHAVDDIGYDPARQQLTATVRDAHGTPATVAAPHNPCAPGGLDALAAALRGEHGELRHLSCTVRAAGDGLVLDPIAARTDDGVLVPDLAAPASAAPLAAASHPAPGDPVTAALETGLAALSAATVHGLRRLPDGARTALDDAAAGLARIGLTTAAAHLRAIPAALTGEGADAAVRGWLDAELYLLTARELHARTA
ncbi:hypothetical protein [Streptomyces roseicoloratus]|uniref:hypothetical protein n=1 Tax=Streptomyces roseicoloratus TaxID=2508722 RepID=UPI0010098A40|nr:hypothetical protein [Streptomyces roseicoloratus]